MPLRVTLSHGREDLGGIPQGFFFENRGESRACVFGVNVDVPSHHRLLGQECAAEIELAANVSVEAIFEMLGDDFTEDELFAEVLGSHAYAGFMGAGERERKAGH